MLIMKKTSEQKHDCLEVILGASRTRVNEFKNRTNDKVHHAKLLYNLGVGEVLVTGCSAVGFDYSGTIKDRSFYNKYVNLMK